MTKLKLRNFLRLTKFTFITLKSIINWPKINPIKINKKVKNKKSITPSNRWFKTKEIYKNCHLWSLTYLL